MNRTERAIVTLALSIVVLFSGRAEALILDGASACNAMGGSWSQGGGADRLGQCTLREYYGINEGDVLELGQSVDLILDDGAVVENYGRLNITKTTLLLIRHGHFINEGEVRISNKGGITLKRGRVLNRGTLFSEGTIFNESLTNSPWTPLDGIYNSGTFTSTHGGVVWNYGNYRSILGGQLIIGRQSRFVNRAGSLLRVAKDLVDGTLINEAGGYIDVLGSLTIRQGGKFENASHIALHGNGNPNRAILRADRGGAVTMTFGSTIDNWRGTLSIEGELTNKSGWIFNDNATLSITAPGVVSIDGNGHFLGYANGTVVNNGSILVGCFADWQDNGTLSGNAVGRSQCYQSPIIPPWIPFP